MTEPETVVSDINLAEFGTTTLRVDRVQKKLRIRCGIALTMSDVVECEHAGWKLF